MSFDVALDGSFLLYALIGFCAQIVDGALGMAYGTLSNAALLALGVPPLTASASVHTAQFFTTGISGAAHALLKNVNARLCMLLAAAGICGGLAGAYLLTQIDGHVLRPWISAYLFCLGLFIVRKVFTGEKEPQARKTVRRAPFVSALGALGGFFDSIGGGGWGPIVTTHLIVGSKSPRHIIGTVSAAEFFVKTAIAAALAVFSGFHFQGAVVGLLAGGIVAAPLGALVLRYIKPERLMLLVGLMIMGLSLWQVAQSLL